MDRAFLHALVEAFGASASETLHASVEHHDPVEAFGLPASETLHAIVWTVLFAGMIAALVVGRVISRS